MTSIIHFKDHIITELYALTKLNRSFRSPGTRVGSFETLEHISRSSVYKEKLHLLITLVGKIYGNNLRFSLSSYVDKIDRLEIPYRLPEITEDVNAIFKSHGFDIEFYDSEGNEVAA